MYYNQNNYAHIPYPAPGYEKATVKSGGCGVCCASMIVEGLLGGSFPPEASAAFAIKTGARVSGGTDMRKLGNALAAEFGLVFTTTSSVDALSAHVKADGWAAANVGGDRSGYTGLFSSGGHYVVVRRVESDGRLTVWDPNYYSGKFDKTGRRGKVTINGNDIFVAPQALDDDCRNRSPRYYLFKTEEEPKVNATDTPSVWAKESWEKAVALGVTDGTNPQQPATREQLIVILDRLGLLK